MNRIQFDGTLWRRDDCIGKVTLLKRQIAMTGGVGWRVTNGRDDRRGGAEMMVYLFHLLILGRSEIIMWWEGKLWEANLVKNAQNTLGL